MHRAALMGLALLLATPVAAGQPEPIDDLQRLFIEDTVALINPPSEEAGARAKALMDKAGQARARSDFAEMRRALAEARVVLAGGIWDANAAFAASLAIQPARLVVDPGQTLPVTVSQFYSARPAGAIVKLWFGFRNRKGGKVHWQSEVAVAPKPAGHTKLVAHLDPAGLADGAYDLLVKVAGDEAQMPTAVGIWIIKGIAGELADIEQRRSRLAPSGPLAASLHWPANLAATLDDRSRQATDIDWPGIMLRTKSLLAEAEAGRDPLAEARGLRERHYTSKVSGRVEPYNLYIPEQWDGKAPLSLVVLLHGSNGDHNRPFASGRAITQARTRGWAVLAPMGYSPNSGWGNHMPVVLANGTMPEPRPSTIAGKVLPRNGVDPEPAEADVLDALADVQAHYPIDTLRIYLGGNSMGGEGTWYLAERHPELWAAIAPGAGAIDPPNYPYARLGTLPVLAVHGDADAIISYAASADMIARLNKAGGKGELLGVAGGGHSSFDAVLPQIFEFFAKQERTP